jgi:hypothetical protein
MLDEMREAALVIAFVEGAGSDDQSQSDAVAGLGVAADDIAQAVGERALDESGISGQVGADFRPRHSARERRQRTKKEEEENAT